MRKVLLAVILFAGLAVACPAGAMTILYNPSGVLSGYKADNSTAFTTAFDTAFAGTAESTADFSNLAQVMSADAIFVNIRGAISSLSSTEQSNLSAFAATGKPLMILGDNYNGFSTWNASVLTPFGGTNYAFSANTYGSVVKVNDHPLTAGLDVLPDTNNPGTIQTGGYALWQSTYSYNPYPVGALFGPANNVLILLELGPLNNSTLGSNMGGWAKDTASAVPEPASLGLLAIGSIAFMARPRHNRAAAC